MELWDRIDGLSGPVAATLPDCASLLGVELAAVQDVAAEVTPYLHADGSPRWSVAELADRLGLTARDHKGHRLPRRTGDRDGGRGRRHARLGAAATNQHRAAKRAAELAEPEPDVKDLADLDADTAGG
jgi:hypothetical protein